MGVHLSWPVMVGANWHRWWDVMELHGKWGWWSLAGSEEEDGREYMFDWFC